MLVPFFYFPASTPYILHSTPLHLTPSRLLSCSRDSHREILPTSTPYALHRRSHHLSCARRWLAVSPVFPCQSVLVCGRYIFPATCCVLPVVWQYSRLFPFAPVAVLCSRISPRVNPCLYTLHIPPYTKKITKRTFFLHFSLTL